MADNTDLNAGSGGDTVAMDDIGGVKHQRVKMQYGADGVAVDVDLAAPCPVEGQALLGAQLGGADKSVLVRPAADFALESSRKHITGQEKTFILGFHESLGTSWEDISPFGGDVMWATGAAKVAISSTDAADDAAGLGLQSVEVHGLSVTGADQDEVIATSGTTEVESTLDYIRVNVMHSEEVGTYGGSHQGDIKCRVTSAGAKTGNILSEMTGVEGAVDTSVQYGSGESGNGFFTVPLGKVAYLTGGSVIINTTGTKTADVILYEREGILTVADPFLPRRELWSAIEGQGEHILRFDSHKKIKALTDIWFRAKASNTGTKIEVYLEFYLLDENASGA